MAEAEVTGAMMPTDFPTKGDDKKITLRNSNYPQFDYEFSLSVKENNKEIWDTVGTSVAMRLLTSGQKRVTELKRKAHWIDQRARGMGSASAEDGKQFADGDTPARPSNIAGVTAQLKWGVIGVLGEQE